MLHIAFEDVFNREIIMSIKTHHIMVYLKYILELNVRVLQAAESLCCVLEQDTLTVA